MLSESTSHFGLERNRYLLLLASLLLSLLVLPFFESLYTGRMLLVAGHSLTLLIVAIVAKSRMRIFLVVMLVISVPIGWSTLFAETPILFVAHCLLGTAAFSIAGGMIVARLIKSQVVNIDSVFAAISAYLLIGMAWALAYWAVSRLPPRHLPRKGSWMQRANPSMRIFRA